MELRIYYSDTDCGGVVYYANYLKYLEIARTEYLRSSGVNIPDLAKGGCLFVVAKAEIEYKYPAGKPIRTGNKQADHGFIHLGFSSNGIQKDFKRVKERGLEILGGLLEFRPGVFVLYFYGPDREVIELR